MVRVGPISRIRLGVGQAAAGLVAQAVRSTGRGGGTTLPGRVLLGVAPNAIEHLGSRLREGSALVTATNGKTTTTAMAATILGRGHKLAYNGAGANLASGVASTLAAAESAELGLLEVDEAAFPSLAEALSPRAVVLGNLFRDQLDRYGELETVADGWREAVDALGADCVVLANADDPRVVDVAAGAASVVTFGIDDASVGSPRPGDASDTRTCFSCGEPLVYRHAYVGHLGDWRCSACDAARPTPDIRAREIRARGLDGTQFELATPDGATTIELGVGGLYNVYNALAAASLARALGASSAEIAGALADFEPAFGRLERIEIGDRSALLLLAKNPAGANEVVRTLAGQEPFAAIMLALNDEIADGRDVSWIWDVEFEQLMPLAERVIASGSRAEELALRFKYGGFPEERLELERELGAALDRGLELTPPGESLAVVPTYTAMLGLQSILTERGLARPYWERSEG